jgi:hypothetical protein
MNSSIYNFIDWTKGDDAQIAAALGVTRQAVAAARKVRRISPKNNHGGKRPGAGRKSKPPQAKTGPQKTNAASEAP